MPVARLEIQITCEKYFKWNLNYEDEQDSLVPDPSGMTLWDGVCCNVTKNDALNFHA